jgi:hypothetical protein
VYDVLTKDGMERRPWALNRHKMGDLLEAFGAVIHLSRDV